MKLPKQVYIRIEKENNGESYMTASETPEGENGQAIGVYKLIATKKMSVKTTLE